jgi:hypothetical protein
MSNQNSLTEALAILGITHKRDDKSSNDYRHSWFAPDGSFIGRYDAHEGWEAIRRCASAADIQRAA